MNNLKKKYGFCILHYGSYSITKKCLDSILEYYINEENVYIVVVDNGMHNLDRIKKDYTSNRVCFLESEKNIGFANGNNIGFNYLKSIIGCDYIILLNNDTLITQHDFLKIVTDIYEKQQCAVIGPKICTENYPEGGNDNPGNCRNYTLQECYKIKKSYQKTLVREKMGIEVVVIKLKSMIRKLKPREISQKDNSKTVTNCILNGSVLIFTPTYVRMFDGLDPRTFMYLEEFILYEHVVRNGYTTCYTPELKIHHDHQVSTNQTYSSRRKKRIFQLENQLKSLDVLIDTIEFYDKKEERVNE